MTQIQMPQKTLQQKDRLANCTIYYTSGYGQTRITGIRDKEDQLLEPIAIEIEHIRTNFWAVMYANNNSTFQRVGKLTIVDNQISDHVRYDV